MDKLKVFSIALIFTIIFLLPLSGCSAFLTFSNNEMLQPPDEGKFSEKNNPKTAGENENSEKGQTPKESSRLALAIPVPEAQAGESTTSQVDKANLPKHVYLTFDDGPNTFFTGRILDILAERQVQASFVVLGLNAEKNPALIKRMVHEGHAVINHTYTHNYQKIYASPEALIADLDKASQALEKILGHPVKVFRPPGGPGNLTRPFYQKLKEKGYQSIGWNISSADTDPNGVTPEQIYKNIAWGLTKIEKMNLAPIILLHDGTQLETIEARPDSPLGKYIQNRESVIAALPKIIDLLKSKGYTFAIIDENTPPPW